MTVEDFVGCYFEHLIKYRTILLGHLLTKLHNIQSAEFV